MNRVGIDLVEVADVVGSIERFGDRFLARVFTAAELSDCAGDPSRLAGRVAAKEAAIKALRLGPDDATPPREAEVVRTEHGPQLLLHGGLAEAARRRAWGEVQLSITHTDCHAAAIVLVTLN